MKKTLESVKQHPGRHAKRIKIPQWIKPMLATLTKTYFSDPQWIYEEKFDGIRALAYKSNKKVTLYSRNKQIMNDAYPEIVEALAKQKEKSFIIDGEIVALKHKVSSFEKLQQRMKLSNAEEERETRVKVYYYVFDLLYLDGHEATKLPLLDRKKLLQTMLTFNDTVRFTEHIENKGLPFFKQACKKGWEGIIAKQKDSPYIGKRSRDWLKFKCIAEQELVIGGYTDPAGSRIGFGALLLGYYKNGKLHYAGKVGTGFTEETLTNLSKKMKVLEQKKCPFTTDSSLPRKNIHWLKPTLVAQIAFAEWTSYNKLRQPRFLGLRFDKKAKDVVQEKV